MADKSKKQDSKTIEFTPANPSEGLKDQFKQGPATQPTAEQIAEYRAQQITKMEAELPYLRMKEEYNRLTIAVWEQDILLGAIPTTENGKADGRVIIPGILGIDLYMRQQEAVHQFAGYRKQLIDQKQREEEELQKMKEQENPEPVQGE